LVCAECLWRRVPSASGLSWSLTAPRSQAAADLGDNAWWTFWRVTFPCLKPGHFFVATVGVIGALQLFDQALIAGSTNGDPQYALMTPVLYLYNAAFAQLKASLPGMMQSLATHLGALHAAKKLPAGLDLATVEAAQSNLTGVSEDWTVALASFGRGDVIQAVDAASAPGAVTSPDGGQRSGPQARAGGPGRRVPA